MFEIRTLEHWLPQFHWSRLESFLSFINSNAMSLLDQVATEVIFSIICVQMYQIYQARWTVVLVTPLDHCCDNIAPC